MCTMTCVWYHLRIHSAPWNLYILTNLAYALLIAAPIWHVHQVHMCTIKYFWHSFTRAQWNLYSELLLTQLRTCSTTSACLTELCKMIFIALTDSYLYHDMRLTSNLRIHMWIMKSLCRHKLCFCIAHRSSKIACAPGSHVHTEMFLGQIHMCSMKFYTVTCFWHSFACAPWHLYALTNIACLSSSPWQIHMCTVTSLWHQIWQLACAPWNIYVLANFLSAMPIASPNSNAHQVHMSCFARAPWNWYALKNVTYLQSSHWQIHFYITTCVRHLTCAFTCAQWNLDVVTNSVCIVHRRSKFTCATCSHVHHEILLTHIHMCTMKSVTWYASDTGSNVHQETCMPHELCRGMLLKSVCLQAPYMFIFIALTDAHVHHDMSHIPAVCRNKLCLTMTWSDITYAHSHVHNETVMS